MESLTVVGLTLVRYKIRVTCSHAFSRLVLVLSSNYRWASRCPERSLATALSESCLAVLALSYATELLVT